MRYSNRILDDHGPEGLRASDIFTTGWRKLILGNALRTYLKTSITWWLLSRPLSQLWNLRAMPLLSLTNERLPALFWLIHLYGAPVDAFEQDFLQAWEDTLVLRQDRKVAKVTIFVGGHSLSVPMPFDKDIVENNKDTETLKKLGMWYSWMQFRGGLGEVIIPRRLMRIDKVEFSPTSLVLGQRIRTYDLGRDASSNVANFLNPDLIDDRQHFLTDSMLSNTEREGLEFVRVWDRSNVSTVGFAPFVLSLLFAIVWVPVCIARYGVDAQVAVQTAFTVASYIVTAGALFIALFAFLDGQVN